MDSSLDMWALLMAISVGITFLMIAAMRGNESRPNIFGRLMTLISRRQTWQGERLRETFSSSSDLRATMKSLPDWAKLEMAEHLILEGPPFAAIAIDEIARIAQTKRGEPQDRALSFLTSKSIPPVARVNLAQRLLVSTIDDGTKISALRALCALASEPEVFKTGLIDSLSYTVAERITDESPQVQAFAVEALETQLKECIASMDTSLAKRLSTTRGNALNSLIRFIDRNSALVPEASKRAHLYDTRL